MSDTKHSPNFTRERAGSKWRRYVRDYIDAQTPDNNGRWYAKFTLLNKRSVEGFIAGRHGDTILLSSPKSLLTRVNIDDVDSFISEFTPW